MVDADENSNEATLCMIMHDEFKKQNTLIPYPEALARYSHSQSIEYTNSL